MPGGQLPRTPAETPDPSLRDAIRAAAQRLALAGVHSPRADATALAGHVLGISAAEAERLALLGRTWSPAHAGAYDDLIGQRSDRVPLQHLTGRAAFRHVELSVGPGVFVPRPETEMLVDLALRHAQPGAVVVDLCTGSGAIAAALATERPDLTIHAVEVDPMAHAWAARNLSALAPRVDLQLGDATHPETLADLDGTVDVVVSNPPYIPSGAVPVDAEVAEHDPELALYGGSEDGLRVPMGVAARAGSLLRSGGWLIMEHADVQGADLVGRLVAAGWANVTDHADLAGRPRTVTAQRI